MSQDHHRPDPHRVAPPPGTRESQTLEFKRPTSLRSAQGRSRLLRNIVGMRNARGGTIWIGFEDGGHGARGPVVPLDPDEDDRHLAALRDLILDRTDPRLSEEEVRLDWVETPEGTVLAITIAPRLPGQIPCCDRAEGIFWSRVADRLRRMGSAELAEAFQGATEERKASGSVGSPEAFLEDRLRSLSQPPAWFPEGLENEPHYALDVALWHPAGRRHWPLPEDALELLRRPPEEVARRDGWTWYGHRNPEPRLRRRAGRLESGRAEDLYRLLRVDRDGLLAFRTHLDHIQWEIPENWKEWLQRAGRARNATGMIYPYALVETTISVLRLARLLWKEHLAGQECRELHVVAQLRLERAEGRFLPPYGPHAPQYYEARLWARSPGPGVGSRALSTPAPAFIENPDSLGEGLLQDVYSGFFPKCVEQSLPIPWMEEGCYIGPI